MINNDENDEMNDEVPLTEEELRELNLYAEEKRQESMAKYGRNIYDKNSKIGNEKIIKGRNFIDKLFDIYFNTRTYILIGLLLIILVIVWKNAFHVLFSN